MSILEKVNETITNELCKDFSDFLADKFGLDSHEVIDTVRDYLGYNAVYAPIYKESKKKIITPPIKTQTSGANICMYVGKNKNAKGKVCGTKIRGGGEFCSKHKDRKSLRKN